MKESDQEQQLKSTGCEEHQQSVKRKAFQRQECSTPLDTLLQGQVRGAGTCPAVLVGSEAQAYVEQTEKEIEFEKLLTSTQLRVMRRRTDYRSRGGRRVKVVSVR